jgi:ribonuclease Z
MVMEWVRRPALWWRMGFAASAWLVLVAALAAQTRVVLVGTGGPELTPERAGEATLVEANGQSLLFDAGRGVLDGLYRSGIAPQKVTHVFLTHLHSDHIEGLPGLWITPWFLLGRTTRLEVWGPPGSQQMIDGMRAMFAHDLEQRPNAKAKRESLDIVVHEIHPGLVYDQAGIRVSAIAVEHVDGNPAFAYRIDTGDSVILLIGDCTYAGELTRLAGRFDLVVSNVAAGSEAMEKEPWLQPVLAKLMRPEQAAKLFGETKPRLAVYSHIVKKGLPGSAGDREILRRTRMNGYKGPLLMGTDHVQIVLGKPVRIEPLASPKADLDMPGAKF